MANLTETAQWEDGIYQIETSDPVLGGPDGISNKQAKLLANRTAYLKQQAMAGAQGLVDHVAAADPHPQYAQKDSPTLTGKPVAPTAAQTSNDTQLATTAFVKAALAALVASSPAALDTLNELAAALGNDANFAATMATALSGKQPLDATLTALAALTGAADKLAYFNGADTVALTALTGVGRDIIGKATTDDVLTYLGLGTAAKKDVGTGTGQIPDMSSFIFTGQDLGSYKLPGGFIVQWTYLTSLDPTGWTLVNFQNAWPTKILGAMAINEAGTVLADKIMGAKRLSDTQLQITCVLRSSGAAAQGGAYVIAWGK